MAPIVKYETVRYNLTPLVEGPFVGYGVEVDAAWDSIANDSTHSLVLFPISTLQTLWVTD